jgi:hypothetical protein
MATRQTTRTDETASDRINPLDDRDARALAECMQVIADGGSLFTVVGSTGKSYTVDAKRGRCECPDMQHNLPDGDREECKHLARVRFAAGERAIPAWVKDAAIDPLLSEQLDAEPRVATTDGGRHFREADRGFEVDDVGDDGEAGGLVYERDEKPGRRLVGFVGVDDWDAIRAELIRRGHGVGALHHLEEFEAAEVRQ